MPETSSYVIVAPATPLGRSALAVVRLTGPGALELAAVVATPLRKGPFVARRARRVHLRDERGVFDDGVLWWAPGPATVTGEDLVEVTCHGNPVVVDHLIESFLTAGARMAQAGEFTRRSVENGKLGLVAAEGVLAAVEASSRAGLAVARQALDGSHAAFYSEVRSALCDVAAELEARLDYPADELAYATDDALLAGLAKVADRCEGLADTLGAGRRVVDGARVALVGRVNAGKSSLFNALVGRRRALVHATPGTTRDVLEVRTALGGQGVTLLDTAGERKTTDPVEAAGLALAQELVADVDLLVLVIRAGAERHEADVELLARTADRPRLIVYNGVDATGYAPPPDGALCTVATTGQGIYELAEAIARAVRGTAPGGGELVIASARQRDLLRTTAAFAGEAAIALGEAGPAVAADLVVQAITELDTLTGADSKEAVLDALFARFCIGK